MTNPGKMVGDESAVIRKALKKTTWFVCEARNGFQTCQELFQDAGYKHYIFLWLERLLRKKQFVPCDLHNIIFIHYLLFGLNYDNHTIIYISIFRSIRGFPYPVDPRRQDLGGPNRWVSSTKETIRPVRPFKSLAPGHHGIKLVRPRNT